MSVSKLSRRALGAVAATSLLVGVLPTGASAATPEPRDITRFACPSDEVPDPRFSDDDQTTAEHRASIACVVWYEIASGKTTTTYDPKGFVTRGQMARFLANLVAAGGVDLPENPPNAFPDDDGTTHEKPINQLAALGVVSGFGDGEYKPHLAVNRAQMATFLNNAYEEVTGNRLTSSQDYFTDDDGAFHEPNINAVAEAGIAAGRTATTYAPSNAVKRDQMATFIAREVDLLVEQKRITKPAVKPADVKLTTTTVEQGGKLSGSIDVQEGVKITSAKVSGCGLTAQALTLTGTSNTFELTIPLTQPAGQCKLTFTISREGGDDVTDEETITVTAVGGQTDAPELVSVSAAAPEGDTVKVTFSFDEALNTAAGADRTSFKLYTTSADAKLPSAATLSGSNVIATFSKADYDAATTAAVAHSAVEDAQTVANPEGSKPLEARSTTGGETQAPDLLKVLKIDATTWSFQFDDPAYDVVTASTSNAPRYHLVFTDGSTAAGTAFTETDAGKRNGTASRDVKFDKASDGESVAGKTVARGYVESGTVSNTEQDDNPLTAEGKTNPLQAEKVNGGDTRPHLIAVTVDAAKNTLTYQFDRGVAPVDADPVQSGAQNSRFTAYRADGSQVTSSTASASRDTVTATFTSSNNTDPIPADTVGGGILSDAVRSNIGGQMNNPDEMAAGQEFKAGQTTAPDLLSVTRSTSGSNTVLTYTFDQPVRHQTSNTDDRMTIYQEDGSRLRLAFAPSTSNTCSVDGSKVVCSAASDSDIGKSMASAVLGGVEAGAVDDPNNAAYRNYETSAPLK